MISITEGYRIYVGPSTYDNYFYVKGADDKQQALEAAISKFFRARRGGRHTVTIIYYDRKNAVWVGKYVA